MPPETTQKTPMKEWDIEVASKDAFGLLMRVKETCKTHQTNLGLDTWESKVWRVEMREGWRVQCQVD